MTKLPFQLPPQESRAPIHCPSAAFYVADEADPPGTYAEIRVNCQLGPPGNATYSQALGSANDDVWISCAHTGANCQIGALAAGGHARCEMLDMDTGRPDETLITYEECSFTFEQFQSGSHECVGTGDLVDRAVGGHEGLNDIQSRLKFALH